MRKETMDTLTGMARRVDSVVFELEAMLHELEIEGAEDELSAVKGLFDSAAELAMDFDNVEAE